MNEFDIIERYFAPLAAGNNAALGLKDDAAILTIPFGFEMVVTKDAIVEGVHFIGNESPALIARKLLRCNLSDLAAMGATPCGYFLALMLPEHIKEEWIASFAEGLRQDQALFSLTLLGGDTTATPGIFSASLTLMGYVPQGKALKRSGAKVGDAIYVSGTIGDAALGLLVAKKRLPQNDFLYWRYLLPQPRLELASTLLPIANSCMDISDGLMQDLGHLTKASGVGAVIHWESIPLSPSARALQNLDNFLNLIAGGGDDYELLFTVALEQESRLRSLSGIAITKIGEITQSGEVVLLDKYHKEIVLPKKGYKHFS